MQYQVGQLEFQTADDPIFDDRKVAIDHAQLRSWDGGVWAVRELDESEDDSEISALIYLLQVFEPSA